VTDPRLRTAVALAALAVLTLVTLGGIRRSNRTNTVIVAITLAALTFFVVAGLTQAIGGAAANFVPFFAPAGDAGPLQALLHATALMFVAYTGYGRIATLGEEVHDPQRTIPRAIIATLVVSAVLYVAVGFVAIAAVGAPQYAAYTTTTAAPLEAIAQTYGIPGAGLILAIGAMTAMLGVLLNLILGLSRVLLAMGRRGDMPPATARIDPGSATPRVAVVVMAVAIGLLVLLGSVKLTWSFSAFTVLVYYAINNLAALRLPANQRIFPRWIAWAGLAACLFLAFWVEAVIWIAGILLIAAGLLLRWARRA
jgi:APA family basic amino acid/polyamine antiporter